jgi:zinc protease
LFPAVSDSRDKSGPTAEDLNAEPALSDRLPVDPDVRTGTLPNGLTYYIRPNQRPEQRAELRLVVDAGSVLEDEDQQGLAHFLEHMAFNGTTRFDRQEIVNYLESIGMRFGPDLNAYTTYDETVYHLQIPTDTEGPLETGLTILREWAGSITLDEEEIDKERGVILEEWRQRRGASTRIWDQHSSVLFQGSRYADRKPIGDMDVVTTFPPSELRRFYRDWYTPGLMAVVAVGDFDAAQVEEMIQRTFGDLRGSGKERPSFPVPDHSGTWYSIAADPEATDSRVMLVVKEQVRDIEQVGDYRRLLIEALSYMMLNQRLYELSRSEEPPFLNGYAGAGRYVRTAEYTILGANVTDGGTMKGLEALLVEARRAREHGFTQSELEREKKELLTSIERSFRERGTTESTRYAREYTNNFLENEPIPGIEYEHMLYNQLIPGITLDEVNAYARNMLKRDNRTVTVSSPDRPGIDLPSEEELAGLFQAVEKRELEPYVDLASGTELMEELPEPGRIVKETVVRASSGDEGRASASGVEDSAFEDGNSASADEPLLYQWELSNGARVVLKPTRFKEDQVLLESYSPGGHSLAPDNLYISAATAADMVGASGVGEFTQIELGKLLAGSTAGVSPYIYRLYEGIRGSSSPEDLETMFQLTYLYFTQPRLDRAAFLTKKQKLEQDLTAQESSPEGRFYNTLWRILNQDHPRSLPWEVEMVDDIDPEAALEIYRDRFSDAGDFTFFLVGSFDLERMRPLVEQYLASLPSTGRQETWRDLGIDPPNGVVNESISVGLEPKSRAQLVFHGGLDWTWENVFLLNALADVMEIPLRETLREKLGGTYSIGVFASPHQYPDPEYQLYIGFGSSPEQTLDLIDALFAQIRILAEEGPDQETIEKVREILRREREVSLQDNGFWLNVLESYYRQGLDPRLVLEYDRLIDLVTPGSIQDAARRFLDFGRYVQVVLYPEGAPVSEEEPVLVPSQTAGQ